MRQIALVGVAVVLLLLPVTSFGRYRFAPMSSVSWSGSLSEGIVPGDQYTVYTGLADAATAFYLTENDIAPVRDDVVLFNGVEEQINDYLNISGLPLAGQRRFVSESTTLNGDGSRTDAIRIRAVNAAGAPADLWPGGLTYNGTPVPHGAIGLGLNMPPSLGGNQPFGLEPGSLVTALSVEVVSDGVSSGQVDLPLSVFIFPSASAWDGTLGLVAFDGANDLAIDSEFTIRITSVVPEPSLASLAALSLLGARRRRGGSH